MQVKRYLHPAIYQLKSIGEREYSQVAYDRLKKIDSYDNLRVDGAEEETILATLSVSRPTLFRWKNRYKKMGLSGLENESRKPRNTRKPTWTEEQKVRVLVLRREFPLWGKAKIAVMYKQRYKMLLSVSTVGRILCYLRWRGDIKSVRFVAGQREFKPRIFDGYAKPWHLTMQAKRPGELIQIDHMSPRHYKGTQYKHFRAICPISKLSFGHVYWQATAANAARFLRYAIDKFPFKITSIQVDGGSEFMGEFEDLCRDLDIALYVLPPRSPEYNGCVERSNSTVKTEFYSQYEGPPTLEAVQEGLEQYSLFYNGIRPHQALDYLPPLGYYEAYIQNEALQSHMY